MTIDEGDDQYRVERGALDKKPRYPLIAGGVVAILILGSVALAGLLNGGGGTDRSSEPSSAASLGAVPTKVPSPPPRSTAPSRSIPASSHPTDGTPRPSLDTPPLLADVALPGSPEIALFQRDGDDVKVLGWRPGDPGLDTKQTIRGAASGFNDRQAVQTALSPDGSLLLVHAYPAANDEPDTFRVFRLEGNGGREIWQSTSLGSTLTAGFVPTGQIVITDSGLLRRGRGWTIVDLSADKPAVHEIELPPIAAPAPSASRDLQTLTINYSPLGVSADGEWVYAMSIHATEPIHRPAYRISIETGDAERIDALPTTGPSRVVSTSVDPRSGRLLLAGPFTTPDQGFVQAWSPGAKAPDFQAELGVVFFAAWMNDGGVITADYDRLPGPFHFRVLSLTATGDVATTFFRAEGTNAGLVGIHNGFAAAYVAATDSATRTLVVIRLSDGMTAGVEVSDPDGLMFTLGLRP